MRRFIDWATLLCGLFASSMLLAAECQGETNSASNGSGRPRKEFTVDSKFKHKPLSEGLELASAHLQELVPVLDQLKLNSSLQYEKAVRELDRASKRLNSIKRRDNKLYEISLREWKIRCQIDLLKAKLQVQKSAPDQERMFQRLKSLREIEIERVTRELSLLEIRAQAHTERIAQSRQMLDKGELRRQQLLKEKQALIDQSVDLSAIDLKAIEPSNKNAVLARQPAGSSSKKEKK